MYSFLQGAQREKSRCSPAGPSSTSGANLLFNIRDRYLRPPPPPSVTDAPSPAIASEDEAQHCHLLHEQQHSCRRDTCQRVSINVSGELFETQLRTLDRFPGTLLGCEAKRMRHWDPVRGQYFFDRHRPSFAAILNYYQTGGRLRRPAEVPEEVFYEELRFFQLDESAIRGFLMSEGYTPMTLRQWSRPSWRTSLFTALHYPKASQFGKRLAVPSVALIIFSVALHCVHSLPSSCEQESATGGEQSQQQQQQQQQKQQQQQQSPWPARLELACVSWFALEFCVKLVVCPLPRLRLLNSAPVWLDAVSFAPYFLSSCLELSGIASICTSRLMRALHFSHVLRVLKLYRYVTGMQILGRTLRMSIRELTMFLFFVGVSVVLFASAIHQAEGSVHKQFQSIPHAFWWAVISLCTVGYGDAVPRTFVGKLIGSACVVAGVMTVALPVPVIVTNFNSVYRRTMLCKRMHHRPEMVHRKVVDQ